MSTFPLHQYPYTDLQDVNLDYILKNFKVFEDDIANLKSRMTTAESNINSLNNRIGTAEGNISSLTSRMNTTENRINNLLSRMTTAESNINSLNNRMGTAEGNISSLTSRMSVAEDDINDLDEFMDLGVIRSYRTYIIDIENEKIHLCDNAIPIDLADATERRRFLKDLIGASRRPSITPYKDFYPCVNLFVYVESVGKYYPCNVTLNDTTDLFTGVGHFPALNITFSVEYFKHTAGTDASYELYTWCIDITGTAVYPASVTWNIRGNAPRKFDLYDRVDSVENVALRSTRAVKTIIAVIDNSNNVTLKYQGINGADLPYESAQDANELYKIMTGQNSTQLGIPYNNGVNFLVYRNGKYYSADYMINSYDTSGDDPIIDFTLLCTFCDVSYEPVAKYSDAYRIYTTLSLPYTFMLDIYNNI